MIVVKDIYNDLVKFTYDPVLREYKESRENLLGLISKAKSDWAWDSRVSPTHLLLNWDAMYILEEDVSGELENGSNVIGLTIVETVDESVRLAYVQ